LRRLQDSRLDVLLQDELNHPSLFWLNGRLRRAYLGQQSAGCLIISIVHHLRSNERHPAWHKALYRQVERRYLQSVGGFIFNSQTTRQAVAEMGIDLDVKPFDVVYPAGDHMHPDVREADIVRRSRQAGPLCLLFLGNLIPRKGLHTLLDALSSLTMDAWQLTVVGSPEMDKAYARAIQQQVARLHIGSRVDFCGRLGEAELARQMAASHVLVVPSTYEGFGIAYLEGMGFGLPAIATTSGGASEIITPGVDGFLLPPGDPLALADCLSLLMNDRQRLLEMSLAARRRYLAHPTWEDTGRSIRDFLQRLVK
jgi:glycosyltransferase involved in cell wall biosynthesis